MSYQALARKWRPQMFSQLMGQAHVVAALSNALSNDRLHHAYLFTGTRGVGKTTIARIFAKSLNCENGVTAEPCGKCQHCVAIEEGRFVDLVEVDAASRTKVEDTREILDNVQYKPTQGRYKVYLIDEVHMLSRHSFNALLKTLEEPPPHIKFLLATTDPQKLPVTILSRCLQFSLKAMTLSQIETQLTQILNAEQIQYEDSALAQLAKSANGSMRDALSLTDQAVAQGNGQVFEANVRNMLGLLDEQHTEKLLTAILKNDFSAAMDAVEQLSQAAVDSEQVLIELMNAFHQIALIQSLPDYVKLNDALADILSQAADSWPSEQVQLYYQVCLRGRRDLPYAAHPRAGLEMTLMRLFAFNPVSIDREEVFTAKKQLTKSAESDVTESSTHQATQSLGSDINSDGINSGGISVDEKTKVESLDNQPMQTHSEPVVVQRDNHSDTSPDLINNSSEAGQNTKLIEQEQDETSTAQLNAQQDQILDLAQSQVNKSDAALAPVSTNMSDESTSTNEIQSEATPSKCANESEPLTEAAEFSPVSQEESNSNEFSDYPQYDSYPQNMDTDLSYQNDIASYAQTNALNSRSDSTNIEAGENRKDNFDKVSATLDQPVSSEISDMLSSLKATKSDKRQQAEQVIENDGYDPNQINQLAELSAKQAAETSNRVLTDMPPWDMSESQNSELANYQPTSAVPNNEVEWLATDEQAQQDRAARNESEKFHALNIDKKVHQGIRKAYEIDEWARLVEQLNLTGLQRQLALHSTYLYNNGVVHLRLSATQQHLNEAHHCQILSERLAQALNQPIELKVEISETVDTTPYQIQQAIEDSRLIYANELIDSDSQVQALLTQFSGQIIAGSIQPV
ncbi:DNA polymerase III subunit gamma/tau [Catenovulum adriaticum]|uniref:DNA-directed DNA polymerase n=1 Tax=Catenovulum adriaticum TaxID=2984846 RepID=A0ABY7ANC3_9ALTE|nr:DNA polymerase III subunit gamma/tau [Catenovulum sp. TS8]WAJ71060.1 DNA polymerase III subunit gamma/tau [Catenovulum sp. TS8]